MKRAAQLMLVAAWLVAGGSAALAEKRVALVIGNDAYEQVTDLQKAVNDARALGDTLEELGFRVLRATNVRRRDMNLKLQEFASQLDPGDVALFFFAGHGVEIEGRNYLLPTDIPSARPGQEDFVRGEGIAVDRVLYAIRARGVRISTLILDACRNNPFSREGTRSLGGTRGLAGMAAPEGSFIMYSAGVGQTALDRLSDEDSNPNSVFTRTLIPLLKQPGLSLVPMARRLRRDVQELARSISHEQRPAYYDEVTGEFFFSGRSAPVEAKTASKPANEPAPKPVTPTPSVDGKAIDLAYWNAIEDSTDVEDFRGYLRQFPTGVFADLAKRRVERLEQDQKTAALTPPRTATTPAEVSKPSGQARGALLGVRVQAVTEDIAKAVGLDTPRGALVASVTEGGPAQAAGLQGGDVILDFNGTKIETMRDLPRLVYFSAPETEVGLRVLRAGSERSLRAKLGKMDPDPILADEEKAAQGDADAMLRMAERYEQAWFGKPDPAEVQQRLVKAAEAGSVHAMLALGSREEEKGPGYLSNAYRWYREAAEKGHVESALKVGLAYVNGNGLQQDTSIAARFLRIAADKGNAEAMLNLAQLTDKGAGVKRDPAAAAKLMLKALMGGHEIARQEMTTNASAWSIDFRRELQRLLKVQGAYQGALDGQFGSGTTAAIAALTPPKPAAPSAGEAVATPRPNNAESGGSSGQGPRGQAAATSPPNNVSPEEHRKWIESLPDDSPFKDFFRHFVAPGSSATSPSENTVVGRVPPAAPPTTSGPLPDRPCLGLECGGAPASSSQSDRASALGLRLAALTDDLRTRHRIKKGVEGVVVVAVESGSEAAGKGIRDGYVILEVSQKEVKTPEEVVRGIEGVKTAGRSQVLLLLSDAGGDPRFVALPVK